MYPMSPPSILSLSRKSVIARSTRTVASEARVTPRATATSSQHASLHPPRDQRAAAAIESHGSMLRNAPHTSHRARPTTPTPSVLAVQQHAIARDCCATYLEQSDCARQRRRHTQAARRHSLYPSSSQSRTSTDIRTRAHANARARTRAHTHTCARARPYTHMRIYR